MDTLNLRYNDANSDKWDSKVTRATLRLMQTTDLHGTLLPRDDFLNAPTTHRGIACLAPVIRAAREEEPHTLLADCGDFLSGSPLGDFIMQSRQGPNVIVAAMAAIGVDIGTIGNHDVEYGLDPLQTIVRAAPFPIVCANLLDRTKPGRPPLFPPSKILTRQIICDDGSEHPLRIGVFGVLPPPTARWNARQLRGYAVRNMPAAARRIAVQLRAAGADVVIALAHTGITTPDTPGARENAAIDLATIPEIDALLLGHIHMTFPGPGFDHLPGIDAVNGKIGGVPSVMAGAMGSHLGLIDLDLERTASGWTIQSSRVSLRAATAPDPDIVRLATPAHMALGTSLDETVGETASPIHTYFALAGHDSATPLINAAQRDAADRALKAHTSHAGTPLLSAAAPFRAGGLNAYVDIDPGRITRRQILALYPFANTFCLLRVTGAQITDWLERSAAIFNLIVPKSGVVADLIDPFVPSFWFDAISGLTYEIDVTQPRRIAPNGAFEADTHRIRNLRIDGRAVAPDDAFIVASNSYRAGAWRGIGDVIYCDDRRNVDILERFVRDRSPLEPIEETVWSFHGRPGAVARFFTGPGAGRLGTPTGLTSEGSGPDGLASYHVAL